MLVFAFLHLVGGRAGRYSLLQALVLALLVATFCTSAHPVYAAASMSSRRALAEDGPCWRVHPS